MQSKLHTLYKYECYLGYVMAGIVLGILIPIYSIFPTHVIDNSLAVMVTLGAIITLCMTSDFGLKAEKIKAENCVEEDADLDNIIDISTRSRRPKLRKSA